jgi:pheromone shutdown protein TraB
VAGDLGGHGRLAKGDGNGIFVEIHSFFMIVHEYSMNYDVLMICFLVWQPDL